MNKRILRLIVISCGAWSTLQVGHELIGHGLTVLLMGGKPLAVNAMYFHYDLSSVSDLADRWIRAGGSIFNVLWALGCFLMLIKKWFKTVELNYFLWVSSVINLLQSGSYVAFGRFIDGGMDWAMIIDGLEHQVYWGYLELIVGLSLLLCGTLIAVKLGGLFIGSGIVNTSKKLYWTPLFSATTMSVISSLIMPTEQRFMMIMGGIGNGFTFLLPLFVLGFFKTKAKNENEVFIPYTSPGVILYASLISIFYLFIMSPGITFN